MSGRAMDDESLQAERRMLESCFILFFLLRPLAVIPEI
jgi:hypothetical protein